MNEYLLMDKPTLKPDSDGRVTFPVSYTYNGGVIVGGEWYKGIKVPLPDVPVGYKLVELTIGYNLNSVPPLKTMLLKKIGE